MRSHSALLAFLSLGFLWDLVPVASLFCCDSCSHTPPSHVHAAALFETQDPAFCLDLLHGVCQAREDNFGEQDIRTGLVYRILGAPVVVVVVVVACALFDSLRFPSLPPSLFRLPSQCP